MKKLLVLHTGGTISMHTDSNGKVAPNTANPMIKVSFDLQDIMVQSVDFFNLPSPHMTVDNMFTLGQKINQDGRNYDGIVITHGTDTLEETAYFLDTIQLPQIPIVLTGAMRSTNELGSDGIYNYLSALRVASHEKSADKGILVVMNDEIHAAKYVTKTHTTNVSTFQTPTHGPLGIIMKKDILFFKAAEPRQRFMLDSLKKVNGNVPIIKIYAGMDNWLFEQLDLQQLDGVIIEALGAGNMPPKAMQGLSRLIKQNIPIALVSRCFNGIAEPVYGYEGGGLNLQEQGVMFVKELNAPKARLKLLIALNAGLQGEDLKTYMEG
ncbi:asparaginase [Avibacterium paragallinarum]|uniref:asparaginase n=1 Tax=Avibacterium paragallinarum TaxID=728 RepID=UPI0039781F9E